MQDHAIGPDQSTRLTGRNLVTKLTRSCDICVLFGYRVRCQPGVMHRATTISGHMLSAHDNPEWRPLVDLVGEKIAEWFMWMFEVELEDGTRLHAYKHVDTRRYFHLTLDGRAFVFRGEHTYAEVEPDRQIPAVLWDPGPCRCL